MTLGPVSCPQPVAVAMTRTRRPHPGAAKPLRAGLLSERQDFTREVRIGEWVDIRGIIKKKAIHVNMQAF